MRYRVKLTPEAEDDLMRWYDITLERELQRQSTGDLTIAEKALEAIADGFTSLSRSPFTCRKADHSPFLWELIIPFGHSGYVALFEIVDKTLVVVAAIRHQHEDDYHG